MFSLRNLRFLFAILFLNAKICILMYLSKFANFQEALISEILDLILIIINGMV